MSLLIEHLEQRQLLSGVSVGGDAFPTPPLPHSAITVIPGQQYHTLSAVPALNSHPSAYAQLVLEFDGDGASAWDFGGGSYFVPTTSAFSLDGDRSTFSDSEIDFINEVWARVAEKYSPFNINVTTVDPGTLANGRVQKVVIGGKGQWLGMDAGGVGTYGGFAGPASNKVYVFSDLAGDSPSVVGEAVAHEAGHGFGLDHQSIYDRFDDKVIEYNPGSYRASPVMGFNPNSQRKLWWEGRDANGLWQSDADIIASAANGFGYRSDDHTLTSSASVDGSLYSSSGVIERPGDEDGFVFNTSGAQSIGVRISAGGPGIMLDSQFEIRSNVNSGYTVFARSNTSNLNETLTGIQLPAGTYRLVVSGTDISLGTDGTGDGLGSYDVKVLAGRAEQSEYNVAAGGSVTLSAAGPNALGYNWDLDGDGVFGESGSSAKRGNEQGKTVHFNAAGLAGNSQKTVHVRVTDGPIFSVGNAIIHVESAPGPTPSPTQWASRDIGAVGATGSSASGADGSIAVTGAGANIYGTADAFQFASQDFIGDGQIVARVDSFNATEGWAKAGVMMRAGLGANAKNAYMYVTPDNGVQFAVRDATGGLTWSSPHVPTATIPQWLKLVRQGDLLKGYASSDGLQWRLIGQRTVALGQTAQAGLAVTSRLAGVSATARFSSASLAPATLATLPTATLPVATSYVRDGASANTAFGDASSLFVKKSSTGYTRETYLQVDLSGVASIGRAVLRLYGNTDGAQVAVGAWGVESSRPVGSLTYNNRPTGGVALGSTVINSAAGWYEWDVTAFLQDQRAAGNTNVTLALRGTAQTVALAQFASSGSTAPQLLIS
jgi:hypothetical protein